MKFKIEPVSKAPDVQGRRGQRSKYFEIGEAAKKLKSGMTIFVPCENGVDPFQLRNRLTQLFYQRGAFQELNKKLSLTTEKEGLRIWRREDRK